MLDDYIKLEQDGSIDKELSGEFIYIRSVTGSAELVTHSKNSVSNRFLVKSGTKIRGVDFDRLTFINKFSGVNEINYIVGSGDFQDTATEISGTVEIESKQGAGYLFDNVDLVANTKTQLLNYDSDRLSFEVENISGADIKIGGSDVLKKHIILQNGKSFVNDKTASLGVYAVGSGKVNVVSHYKTEQEIIKPGNLTANGSKLVANDNYLVSY